MRVSCTYCGKHFTHMASEGRPPSFCTDKCRQHAKRDPNRLCRGCGKRFPKQEMQFPTFCSEACKNKEHSYCLQCGAATREDSRFCSGVCLAAHQGVRNCVRCGGPVPTPETPPFNKMPRFCSDLCRTNIAVKNEHFHHRIQSEALRLRQLLDYSPQPLWRLPHKRDYIPFVVPHDLTPSLTEYDVTAKVINSIAWWSHCLPLLVGKARIHKQPPWVLVSYVGRISLGGVSTPTGILPLYQCLPWVNMAALIGVDLDNVISMWHVASNARRFSEREIERRLERIREWIVEYDEGKWMTDPRRSAFFKHTEHGSSRFVQSLAKWQAMHTEPTIDAVYLPNHADYLHSDKFQTEVMHILEIERVRKRHWRKADYKDDPAPPPDRTMDAIERIMDDERRRLSR